MNKNSFGKALTTLGLAATIFTACNSASDNKEMGKAYHKQDSVILSKALTDLTLNDVLNDQSARDSIAHSENSIWTILDPKDAQKIIQYLKKRRPVTIDIEGFGEVDFCVAGQHAKIIAVHFSDNHFFVGIDGMTSGSSFDQSQYGSNVKNATKIKQDMNFIMQAFLNHMNK